MLDQTYFFNNLIDWQNTVETHLTKAFDKVSINYFIVNVITCELDDTTVGCNHSQLKGNFQRILINGLPQTGVVLSRRAQHLY